MLSKKCQYAIHALVHLVENQDRIIHAAEICNVRSIPKKFLENILLDLKKHGILESKRGKSGGYYFRRDPAKISIIEIIRLMDGAVAMLPCVSLNFYRSCGICTMEETCAINRVFASVRDQTNSILSQTYLSEIGLAATRGLNASVALI